MIKKESKRNIRNIVMKINTYFLASLSKGMIDYWLLSDLPSPSPSDARGDCFGEVQFADTEIVCYTRRYRFGVGVRCDGDYPPNITEEDPSYLLRRALISGENGQNKPLQKEQVKDEDRKMN